MRLIQLIGTFLLLAGAISCTTDFDIAAPYRPVMSVIGVMNINTDTNYLRIQKGFLDNYKSALDMATVADSNLWKDLDVSIVEYSKNYQELDRQQLELTDLTDEGLAKQDGLFFTTPSQAYRYQHHLENEHIYRLIIVNNETGNTDSAELQLPQRMYLFSNDYMFKAPKFNLNFPKADTTSGIMLTGTANGAYFAYGHMRIYFAERNINTGAVLRAHVDYPFKLNIQPKAVIDEVIRGENFYNFLRVNLGAAPAGIERYLIAADVSYYAGDEPLYRYHVSTSQYQRGVTGGMALPIYTNIKGGDECIGIFGVHTTLERTGMPFDSLTLTGLQTEERTKPLNFVGFMPL